MSKPLTKGYSPGRCYAKSKRSGKQCQKRPMFEKTLCHMHGGRRQGVPNVDAMKTGIYSQFIHKDDLPKIQEIAEKLRNKEGRAEVMSLRSAAIQEKLDKIGDDQIDTRLKGEDLVTKQVKLVDEIQRQETPSTIVPVFQVSTEQQISSIFMGRGANGEALQIRVIDGEPFVLESGSYHPAVKQVDDETGAEIYLRLLNA